MVMNGQRKKLFLRLLNTFDFSLPYSQTNTGAEHVTILLRTPHLLGVFHIVFNHLRSDWHIFICRRFGRLCKQFIKVHIFMYCQAATFSGV